MSADKIIAKRPFRPFDLAMDKIWISIFLYMGRRYVLIHFMNNNSIFGADYIACENITQLNDIKSKIMNNKFSIDWDVFNIAMSHLK